MWPPDDRLTQMALSTDVYQYGVLPFVDDYEVFRQRRDPDFAREWSRRQDGYLSDRDNQIDARAGHELIGLDCRRIVLLEAVEQFERGLWRPKRGGRARGTRPVSRPI